ncbi:MAG: hypothetical protein AAB545_01305 [Patescibacteria group bacterium]
MKHNFQIAVDALALLLKMFHVKTSIPSSSKVVLVGDELPNEPYSSVFEEKPYY